MESIWAHTGRSWAVQPRQLLLCILLFAAAESRADLREHERRLTEIDKEYLAPEVHRTNESRRKCAGVGQFATLKGEWVRFFCRSYLLTRTDLGQ